MTFSGPLSRPHFSSDFLLLGDEDAIPWTYVSPQAEHTQDDAVTYTSEGVANKKRKIYKKKKDIAAKSTKSSSDLDSEVFLDWTEAEEHSLCLIVAICLQKESNRDNSNGPTMDPDPSSLENDQAQALLSKNLPKELQRVCVSKVLAECFVPAHEYPDVIARVKSSAFRRKFISFLQSKAKRKTPLVAEEANVESSSESSSKPKDVLKSATQKESMSKFTKPEIRPSVKGNPKRAKCKNRKLIASQTMQIEDIEQKVEPAEMGTEASDGCSVSPVQHVVQSETQQEQLTLKSDVKRGKNCRQQHRSSSRLRTTRHQQVQSTNKDADTDEDDKLTARHLSAGTGTCEDMDHKFSTKNAQTLDTEKPGQQKEEIHATKREAICDSVTHTSCKPAKAIKEATQRHQRKKKAGMHLTSKESAQLATEISPKTDDNLKFENTRQNVTLERLQKTEAESKHLARQSKKRSSSQRSQHEETEVTVRSQPGEGSETGPLLAAVQPLRDSQPNVKDSDKSRSFKTFRKKLLDRCLEAQHSGLTLTARIPAQQCSNASQVFANLDEYLTMQRVQQNRKSILDACLMAQREAS